MELHCAWKPLSVIPMRYSKLLRIRIWDAYMHMGYIGIRPIHVQDVPYVYGTIYTYWAEHIATTLF